jgi:hypothetical protein
MNGSSGSTTGSNSSACWNTFVRVSLDAGEIDAFELDALIYR